MKNIAFTIKNLQKCNYAKIARVKVIVLKDYEHLVKNEVTKVRAGFMRNDLFPNGVAQYATKENMEKYTEKITDEDLKVVDEKKRGQSIKKRLLKAKCLYMFADEIAGSLSDQFSMDVRPVTAEMISKEIMNKYRIYLDPKDVWVTEPIDSIGTYIVPLRISEYQVHEMMIEIKTKDMLRYLEDKKKKMDIITNPIESIKEEERRNERSRIKEERVKELRTRISEKLTSLKNDSGESGLADKKIKKLERDLQKDLEKEKRKEVRKGDHEKRKQKKSLKQSKNGEEGEQEEEEDEEEEENEKKEEDQ